ncbi:MAG: 50S ribosomal protein L18 [candidate division WOR-3 bacterium]|uniref:Large ribosomal subunit protein uL18 n=1 Tax=candidate division WOR-3 bacterium TaxID=2052148 RepID=A0A7V3ZT82_UNCW3
MQREEKILRRKRRHLRVRKKVIGTPERPRLCVYKSLKHIYAQIVIDQPFGSCKVLTGASTCSPEIREKIKNLKTKVAKAKEVGKLIAERATKLGIKKVVFDRAGYKYHGRIKALAEGAREGGLEF